MTRIAYCTREPPVHHTAFRLDNARPKRPPVRKQRDQSTQRRVRLCKKARGGGRGSSLTNYLRISSLVSIYTSKVRHCCNIAIRVGGNHVPRPVLRCKNKMVKASRTRVRRTREREVDGEARKVQGGGGGGPLNFCSPIMLEAVAFELKSPARVAAKTRI